MFSAAQMVTMETPTRNLVLGRKVLDTGFFHPIPVSDDSVPVNLGRYEITYATLVSVPSIINISIGSQTCKKADYP